MEIQLNSGLHINLNEKRISIDCKVDSESDFGFISHAHADHTPSSFSNSAYICSDLTYDLTKKRVSKFSRKNQLGNIELINSGHIPGSSGLLLNFDNRIFYTGDFSTRDRMHLTGLNTPDCDKLVMESTYGHPRYKFPEQDILEENVTEWFRGMRGEKVVCKGYSLGRAQEIEILARRAGFDNILVNKATKNMNSEISDEDNSFSTDLYRGNLPEDTVLITSNKNHIRDLSGRKNVSTATFTGWVNDGRYNSSATYDRAFTLSDHADFTELISVVEEANPDIVYTIHGYKDRLAKEIRSRLGIEAQSLKEGQMTLGDF
jgi:putative mRNA 3-end processing factor